MLRAVSCILLLSVVAPPIQIVDGRSLPQTHLYPDSNEQLPESASVDERIPDESQEHIDDGAANLDWLNDWSANDASEPGSHQRPDSNDQSADVEDQDAPLQAIVNTAGTGYNPNTWGHVSDEDEHQHEPVSEVNDNNYDWLAALEEQIQESHGDDVKDENVEWLNTFGLEGDTDGNQDVSAGAVDENNNDDDVPLTAAHHEGTGYNDNTWIHENGDVSQEDHLNVDENFNGVISNEDEPLKAAVHHGTGYYENTWNPVRAARAKKGSSDKGYEFPAADDEPLTAAVNPGTGYNRNTWIGDIFDQDYNEGTAEEEPLTAAVHKGTGYNDNTWVDTYGDIPNEEKQNVR